MAYTPFYGQWIDADYDANGNLVSSSSTPFTSAAAEHWDAALDDALPQTVKGDLVGFDGTDTQRLPVGTNGAALVADSTQAAGVVWSTTAFVPASQRAPLGGSSSATYAATVTLNAADANAQRITATGNLTLGAPTNPAAGQSLMVEVVASGANRTVTLDTPIVLTTGTVRAYTVTSGQRGFLGLRYSINLGAWILLAQTQTIAG